MKTYNQPIDLIIQTPPVTSKSISTTNFEKELIKVGIAISTDNLPSTKTVTNKKISSNKTSNFKTSNVIIKTTAKDTEINPWDLAHLSFDALKNNTAYIEPDFTNEFTVDRKVDIAPNQLSVKSFGSGKSNDNFDADWDPKANLIWHLGDNFSQLKSARDAVGNIDYNIRIGHLDTGYSLTHFAVPERIKQNPLQRNFIDGENVTDAHDPFVSGFLKQPGHGTGTICLLAGNKIDIATDNGQFQDFLGGAYFADVISCRISPSVALIKTKAFAEALNYLTEITLNGTQVHVVSMSMGGAPSKIWADAVNAAYEAGITIVTAAGNNFSGLPTSHVIYPARFGRVIGACGVTYNFEPYETNKLDEMQGNFGPLKDMSKVLAAFTPNMPWASVESGTIRFSGAGTSSATPQIAAAAAIYYRKYNKELDALQPWQRVEAIRNALYNSALKKVKENNYNKNFKTYFGNGIIQANDALKIGVANNLTKTPPDKVPWFPILNTIFKALPNEKESNKLDMFNTELAQLVFNHPSLRNIIDDENKSYDKVGKLKWKTFKDAIINHPDTSTTLKNYLKTT